MNGSRWYTKEDVLNDLAEMTGGKGVDFDEDCIVRGMRPPPPPRNFAAEEDEEMIERFGRSSDRLPVTDVGKPDLHGITEMLRMVDVFENPDEDEHLETIPSAILAPTRVIISKLNPNVNEFVPTAMRNTPSPRKRLKNNCDKNPPISTPPQSDEKSNDVNKTIGNNDIPKNKVDDELRLLKQKIEQTSKASTLKEKTDRNVAISALMKLASAQPRPADVSPKPVLIPPAYYKAPRSPKHINVEDNAEHFIPQSGSDASTEKSSASSVIDLTHTLDQIPVLEPVTVECDVPKEILHSDSQVQESIEKVNNWCTDEESKPKPKPMIPQMGAFVYRKRDSPLTNTPKSPNSDKVKDDGIKSFVPSKYADELIQVFDDRKKAIEEEKEKADFQNMDVWGRLQVRLKAREEALRNGSNQDAGKSSRSSKKRQTYS